jgi:hypothetical protein
VEKYLVNLSVVNGLDFLVLFFETPFWLGVIYFQQKLPLALKRSFSKIPTRFLTPYREFEQRPHKPHKYRLGSMAGPVIQATGKSTFEDGLRSGGSGSDLT